MKNEVTFGGRVTRDLDPRKAGRGKVVNFSLAQNTSYTVKNGNEQETREETIFIDCVAWNKLVDEMMQENVGKGTLIEVIGTLNQSKWEDKDGNKRSRVEIKVREFSLITDTPKKVKKVAPPTEADFAAVAVSDTSGEDDTPF